MKKRSPIKTKEDPARYALEPGTGDVIANLCKTGLTFDEALDEFITARPHPGGYKGTTEAPASPRPPLATRQRRSPVDPDA